MSTAKKIKIMLVGLLLCISFEDARAEFVIKPYYEIGSLHLRIAPYTGSSTINEGALFQEYGPNVKGAAGLSISTDFFSLSYSLPADKNSEQGIVDTKFTDIQFTTFFERFGIDVYFQKFEGLEIKNAPQEDMTLNDNDNLISPQFPNLTLEKKGLGLSWVMFPSWYSAAAMYNQAQLLRHSGFSPIVQVNYSEVEFDNVGQSIFSANQQSFYTQDGGFSGASMKSYGGRIGLGATLLLRKMFYLSGQGMVGRAKQKFIGRGMADESERDLTVKTKNWRLSVGYNTKTYFAGGTYKYDSEKTTTSNMTIEPVSELVTLFVGMRF